MDGARFDAIARGLAATGSRRRLVVSLAAALGTLGVRGGGAAACRPPGSVCREHANCCSTLCGPKNATGRHTCRCQTEGDCPTPTNTCLKATCTDGVCGTTVGVTCPVPDQCHQAGTCDPATGVCSNPPKGDGTGCNAGVCTTGDTCQNGVCTSSGVSICGDLECCAGTTCVPREPATSCLMADGTCAAGGTERCPCCDPSTLSCVDTCGDLECCAGTICVGIIEAGTCRAADGSCAAPGTERCPCCDLSTQSCVDVCGDLQCCAGTICVAREPATSCLVADGSCAAGGTADCPCCDPQTISCVSTCPGGTICVGGICQ